MAPALPEQGYRPEKQVHTETTPWRAPRPLSIGRGTRSGTRAIHRTENQDGSRRCGPKKKVHIVLRGFLDGYQYWREEQNNELGKRAQISKTNNPQWRISTIKRMWREVALVQAFVTRDQLPEVPYAKAPKNQSYLKSAFSVEEWVQIEKTARIYWIEGKSRYDEGEI